jgi:hypothetical protein
VTFRTQQDYLYARDSGTAFAHAIAADFSGFGVFALPHHTVDTVRFVELIREAANELGIASQFKITIGPGEAPFISELDWQPFAQAFPGVENTPLREAIRQSLEVFMEQVKRGWLSERDIVKLV